MEPEEYPLREIGKGASDEKYQTDGANETIKATTDNTLTRRIVGFVFGICASFFIAAGASCVQVRYAVCQKLAKVINAKYVFIHLIFMIVIFLFDPNVTLK